MEADIITPAQLLMIGARYASHKNSMTIPGCYGCWRNGSRVEGPLKTKDDG